MIQQDVNKHLKSGKYLPIEGSGGRSYRHVLGWTNHLIGHSLLYSHRVTEYARENFDEAYHAHAFFELILFIRGNVDFICNQNILAPPAFSVVWSRPGEFHNARLLGEGCYERYVFRFDSDAFFYEGREYALLEFMEQEGNSFSVAPEHQRMLLSILEEIDHDLAQPDPNHLLAYAGFLRFLGALNRIACTPRAKGAALPQNVLEIKRYIEEHYTSIHSVNEISKSFFYSREHISRLFKQYFNMSVAEYLTRYRVARSMEMLERGESVTDTCFASGFGSMSAFSASFRRVTGCLPSHWARSGTLSK